MEDKLCPTHNNKISDCPELCIFRKGHSIYYKDVHLISNCPCFKLCGKCSKPKGKPYDKEVLQNHGVELKQITDFCNCGRPTTYKEEYIQKVDEYIQANQDEVKEVVKYQSENSTGYEQKWKVSLPTIEGFSLFIGVPKRTLYEWKEEHPEFSHSLDKIVVEQQKRLINEGLSGNYNPTIAKLILSANHDMREKGDVTSDGKAIKGNSIMFSNFKDEER